MSCNSCMNKKRNILWPTLLGATFLFCSLIIYQFLFYEGFTCSSQSGCSKLAKLVAEKLVDEECQSLCKTKECIDYSNQILNNMDQHADPCTNFYDFACGKYKEKYEGGIWQYDMNSLYNDLYLRLRELIETSNEPSGSAMDKLKIVYNSCMNASSSEFDATEDLLKFLTDIGIPDWPYLSSNFSFSNSSLPEILGKISSYQQSVFFNFHSSPENSPSRQRFPNLNVSVEAAFPLLEFEWNEKVDKLKTAVVIILRYLGLDSIESSRMWEKFITMESQIYELKKASENASKSCENSDYEQIHCQEEHSGIRKLLCSVLNSVVKNGELTPYFNSDHLDLTCDNKYFIENIYGIIETYNDREIANYIALKVFVKKWNLLSFSLRKKLQSAVIKTDDMDFPVAMDKWKRCINWVANNMQIPLISAYVAKFWPAEEDDQVNDLVQNILNATSHLLVHQQWIGEFATDLKREVDKMENDLSTKIKFAKDITILNRMYKKFNPSRSDFMHNVLEFQKLYFSLSFFAPVIKNSPLDKFSAFNVNAAGGLNVYLTFGILLPPLFHYRYPTLFNLAKVGHVIGHEISHNTFQSLNSSESIDNKTKENFVKKKDCLIDQYSRFKMKRIEKDLPSNRTISEDFPDNMGWNIIEKIAEKYIHNMSNSGFSLPGLKYTPEKLFYIAFAQTWCAVLDVDKENFHYDTDPHTIPEFRIIGILQNSRRFAKVFNCSKFSYMNPEKKCVIIE